MKQRQKHKRAGLCNKKAPRFFFPAGGRCLVMGIVNVTPDSFSDGGMFCDTRSAVRRAMEMIRAGADIIDIGGESTRPGAGGVSGQDECERVLPVIRQMRRRSSVPISIDTRKAVVARAALQAGASIVNDVSGLRHDPDMAQAIRRAGATVILMHMKGTPADMQVCPSYRDVLREVRAGLKRSIALAMRAGIRPSKIIIDPGFGFGKSFEHNLILLDRLEMFASLRKPLCVGLSRKAFLGKILDIPRPADRLLGTVVANTVAVMKGARVIRVHDVAEAKVVVRVVDSVIKESPAG